MKKSLLAPLAPLAVFVLLCVLSFIVWMFVLAESRRSEESSICDECNCQRRHDVAQEAVPAEDTMVVLDLNKNLLIL